MSAPEYLKTLIKVLQLIILLDEMCPIWQFSMERQVLYVNEATPGVAIPPSVTVLATCLEQHWTFPSGRWRPLFNWNYSMYHRKCTRFCYTWSWDNIGFCAYFMSVQHSFVISILWRLATKSDENVLSKYTYRSSKCNRVIYEGV